MQIQTPPNMLSAAFFVQAEHGNANQGMTHAVAGLLCQQCGAAAIHPEGR